MGTSQTSATEGDRRVRATPQSDIYSLAMVVVEVLPGFVYCLFKLLHLTFSVLRCSVGRYRILVSPTRTSWSSHPVGGGHKSPWTAKNLVLNRRFGNSPRNVGIGTQGDGLTSPMSSTVSKQSSSQIPWLFLVARMNPLGGHHFLQPKDSSGGRLGPSLYLSKNASTSSIR